MASQKDEVSDPAEDLPSDFFDDFSKDEFMEGLSVIDECRDDDNGDSRTPHNSRSRIVESLDHVKDLRELIGDSNLDDVKRKPKKKFGMKPPNSKYKWHKPDSSGVSSPDNYTKPGSRRDPSKTNEAIKKDKEVKVQQFLAKTLSSTDDLRPPGTELDDYYEEGKKKKEPIIDEEIPPVEHGKLIKESPAHSSRRSPRPRHNSRPRRNSRPRHSPRPSPRHSPRPSPRRSPRSRHSPRGSPRGSPRRSIRNVIPYRDRHTIRKFSPPRTIRRNLSPQRRVPLRRSPLRRSPRRYSPGRRSPRRQRSRSPRRFLGIRRSRTRSRSRSPHHSDNFLYPNNMDPHGYPLANPPYQPEIGQPYVAPMIPEYPGNAPGYPAYPPAQQAPQIPAYGVGFPDPYNYGVPQLPPNNIPGPVPMPVVNPVPDLRMMTPVSAPPMVPAPTVPIADKATPYDALAQLVAEGKISQEDYLKLTPNKGQATALDIKTRVMVLTRCNQALCKLEKLLLPNRLTINNQAINADDKQLAPKYCSPLKRQAVTEFSFTKGLVSPEQHTKQLVESIISTLGLDKVVSKYKKKLPKDMKESGVQTTKHQCEVCEIRDAVKRHDVGTSIEPEYFTSSVHTQVVEQDLVSSKSIFNPTGSIGDGAAISIAHMTPAQLVSQLAARAKTLKQPQDSPPQQNQFSRRPPPNYEYDGRGGQQYHHSYNYRY